MEVILIILLIVTMIVSGFMLGTSVAAIEARLDRHEKMIKKLQKGDK